MPGYRTATGVYYYEKTYVETILELDPIAYWPLAERFGSKAYDATQNHFDGNITGATLGEPGIGDGLTSMLFDGVNDIVDIWSPGFRDAFNELEGTAMIWWKVFNVGVWTDGAFRAAWSLTADDSNRVRIIKRNTNNDFDNIYEANGDDDRTSYGALTTIGWVHMALAWSDTADTVVSYFNAVPTSRTPIGAWVGALNVNESNIGANEVGESHWHGYLAHPALFDRPLTAAEVQLAYRARWTR